MRRQTAVVALLVLAISSCTADVSGHGQGHGHAAGAATVATPRLTGAQLRYGATPHLDPSIHLQPDVVLIGGGAEAVRSVSANGLVWTLDPSAPGVRDLAVSKVMFATALGAGRVLGLHATADGEQVVIGPASLTDVIRDGHLASSAPIPLTGVEGYATPAGPTDTDNRDRLVPDSSRDRSLTLPTVHLAAPSGPAVPPPLGNLPSPTQNPGSIPDGNFHLRPYCCGNGLGVQVAYGDGGINLLLDLSLQLHQPRVVFNLDISGGRLNEASLELQGGAGISASIEAASGRDRQANIPWKRIRIPLDFTVPIVVLGFPLLATLSQTFTLATVFLDKASTFKARGDFGFGGALGFGLHQGHLTAYAPNSLESRTPFVSSIEGSTLSDVGMRFGYAAVFSIGVGIPGFSAGAWFKLALGIQALKGSQVSLEPNCKAASLTLEDAYGFGYRIPQVVATVVNFFLRVVHARPISASEGWARGPFVLVQKQAPAGGVKTCLR